MDAEKLRELRIATAQAKLRMAQTIAAKKPAGLAAETYQILKQRLEEAEKQNK